MNGDKFKMRIVKCKKCGKMKKHHAKGLCETCYVNERLMNCNVMGHQFTMSFPLNSISKEDAKAFFEMKKKEIFADAIKNPGKYLE